MFLLDGDVVLSASDLRQAAECEFALLRSLDTLLGRVDQGVRDDDPMSERLAELGTMHEQAHLRELMLKHPAPGAVLSLPRPQYSSRASLEAAMQGTLEATAAGSGREVITQGTVFDGTFIGHVDFLERTADGWVLSDTKLAREATVAALLQLGAYAALLQAAGVDLALTCELNLGSGVDESFPVAEVVAVYHARRERLDRIVQRHLADPLPASWDDPDVHACGRCAVCEEDASQALDLVLVAGMRMPTRRRLLDAGVLTVADLAARTEPVRDVRESTLARLREQARLQLEFDAEPEQGLRAEVIDQAPLRSLPAPSAGDLFFDFEGDPLWVERGSSTWGLEYLFGMVEVDGEQPAYRAFWAHDRLDEKAALIAFVTYVNRRRQRWPGMHVYHYAPYEVSALLRIAARYGVCEDDIDQWLRDGVFVDLYAVVRASLRVSSRSYSLKKLEPLYMPAREAAVTAAADSIVAYHRYMALRDIGRTDEARAQLTEIEDYNRDDCVSTMLLRDWLRAQADTDPTSPGEPGDAGSGEAQEQRLPSPARQALMELERTLREKVEDIPLADRSPTEQAVALAASSVLFHAREDKPKWQAHFERLRVPVRDWRGEEGVFVVDDAEVLESWHRETPRQRKSRRVVRLVGEPLTDVPVTTGAKVQAVYAAPAPAGVEVEAGWSHGASNGSVTILSTREIPGPTGRLQQEITILELTPGDGGEHTAYPVALVPSDHVSTQPIDAALAEFAQRVLDRHPDLPECAGSDLLTRRTPRLRGGGTLPVVGAGESRHITAITEALRAMDSSYLAVQGPPGTGKTWVGARVIRELVAKGWRIGVCAQSHAAVENLLAEVVEAGVDPEVVGKASTRTDVAWTALAKDTQAAFASAAAGGYVLGGTAWDFTNTSRVARGQLDLLVIDEAGQFSLAKTLAVAMAADRLLLLGDPQQLPQVSTGSHPDPVDESALGWLLGGEPLVPATHGYFLETTYRMHPELTSVVSELAYAGQLRSAAEVTSARSIEGVRPGLHVRLVDHGAEGRWSREEAAEVVSLVAGLLGRRFTAGPGRPERPLEPSDIIVITPYNAQASAIRSALAGRGLDESVRVGTVDKFQGQQAAVAIVSLAVTGADSSSRGLGFLLDRHRLNVAISRGQVAAYLVHSPALLQVAPRSAGELLALGAFLRLHTHAVAATG